MALHCMDICTATKIAPVTFSESSTRSRGPIVPKLSVVGPAVLEHPCPHLEQERRKAVMI